MPKNKSTFTTEVEAQSMQDIRAERVRIQVYIPRELYDRLALFGADPLRRGKLRKGFLQRIVADALESWYQTYISSEDGMEDLRTRISQLREEYRNELRNPFAE